ncbi:6,7-dimethyl-8-ribityllumazine synthase [Planctomycetota bacterium]|jgi:6,7-dimethyl-8-ribityllumazine synthase|nr:6,7-dimethyl-8-ribityllumazine synthase [Planctomycetota bacterium]|tara:strand:+ start:373 stop:882 length:510 start_codon:yes stop_codon:yes gene_type:complete
MVKLFQGSPRACNSIAIVVARFNSEITSALTDGAIHTLKEAGVADDNIHVYHVPGALEIPLMCEIVVEQHDAVIALGCVIQGDTPHFDYVCNEASRGILDVALRHRKPVMMGVLTCATYAQAQHRSSRSAFNTSEDAIVNGEKATPECNKGCECARAALEMISLIDQSK